MGVSSDGDVKVLSAMVHEASLSNGILSTQDMVHICTKARNGLLLDRNLTMGNRKVKIDHLQKLLKIEQKSVHKLTYQDIFPTDRMNYTSFEKIVNDCVITSLKEKVRESEATAHYLITFRDISDSFLKFDIEPLQRIFLMYRSLYFLRLWRAYIRRSPFYNLEKNFITYNLYTCVELNARALVILMKTFRDNNREEEFLPSLFDSQTCERLFRLARSLGTTKFTRINFDLLDFIHIINRLDTQNDIAYVKLNISGINIPSKRQGKTKFFTLPTDEQISNAICQAKKEAYEKANFFEMTNGSSNEEIEQEIEKYEFHSTISMNREQEYDSDYVDKLYYPNENASNCDQDELWFDDMDGGDGMDLEMDHDDDETLDEKSPLTYVIDKNNEKKLVRKSTLLWMLTEKTEKLSNDRLKRVQK